MKIGIITLIGMDNHGNRLQNWALEQVILNLGHKAYTIYPNKQSNIFKRIAARYFVYDGKIHLRPYKDIKRGICFRQYSKKNHFDIRYGNDGKLDTTLNDEYDFFIVGSDQVWNPFFWNKHTDTDQSNYLLSFANPEKRLSYAASLGINTLPKEYEDIFKDELRKFKSISVREMSAKNYLSSLIDKEISVVLDPTMLIDVSEWRKQEKKLRINKKYICIYSLGGIPSEEKKKLDDLRNKSGFDVIDVLEDNYYSMGPASFLSLIDNSEFVFTDSFHAVVFSLIFHKPFMVFNRKHTLGIEMGSRIESLLNQLNIKENVGIRALDELYNLDFSTVEYELLKKRNQSLKFLESVLHNEY